MKKIAVIVMFLNIALYLSACGSSEAVATAPPSTSIESAPQNTYEETAAVATEEAIESEDMDQYETISEPEIDDTVYLPEDFWIETFWGEQTKEGYNLEFSTRITDLISFDAPNTARAAWEELGGDFSELPDMQQLKNTHPYWNGGNFSTGYYGSVFCKK